ncbi:hypothetical protein [Acinetobacter sp.]|uniref:hypothetical protein n=1 Tax=Acinetobacter sp. TaxID=472 RepID=UPI003D08E717
MKKILSNTFLMTAIAIIIVTASLIESWSTNEWHWFGRSGAWATMIGVILSVRPLIRMGLSKWIQSLSTFDGGNMDPTPEEIEEDIQIIKDMQSFKRGVYMSIIGTLIWAYGDLLGRLL